MGLEIEAVYQDGTLRLERPLGLDNGQKVTVTIHPPGGVVKRGQARFHWTGSREDLERLIMDPEFGAGETA